MLAFVALLAVLFRFLDRLDSVEGPTDRTSCSVQGACTTVVEDPTIQAGQQISAFPRVDPKGADRHVASDHPVEDVAKDVLLLLVAGRVLHGFLSFHGRSHR